MRVEDLNRNFPGLEDYVRAELERGTGIDAIVAGLVEKFGAEAKVSRMAVWNYHQRRFAPDLAAQKAAYQNARARADLLLEMQKRDDRDANEIVALIVKSQILEKSEELSGADPLDLVKLDLRRQEGEGRMEIERAKLQQADRELALKRDELALEREKFEQLVKQSLTEVENEVANKTREGRELSPKEVVDNIRERIFGIGPRGSAGAEHGAGSVAS
jgi:hypothetical protein